MWTKPFSEHYREPEDISESELHLYLLENKIDPFDLLRNLINGYHQTHLIFDEIRS